MKFYVVVVCVLINQVACAFIDKHPSLNEISKYDQSYINSETQPQVIYAQPQTNLTENSSQAHRIFKMCMFKQTFKKLEKLMKELVDKSNAKIAGLMKSPGHSQYQPITNNPAHSNFKKPPTSQVLENPFLAYAKKMPKENYLPERPAQNLHKRKIRQTFQGQQADVWNKCVLRSELEEHKFLENEHILSIQQELEKLKMLVRLLRDQQYILNMLSDYGNQPEYKKDDIEDQQQLLELLKLLKHNLPQEKAIESNKIPNSNPIKVEQPEIQTPTVPQPQIQRTQKPKVTTTTAKDESFENLAQEIDKLKLLIDSRGLMPINEEKLELELENQKKELHDLHDEINRLRTPHVSPIHLNHPPTKTKEENSNSKMRMSETEDQIQIMQRELQNLENKLSELVPHPPNEDIGDEVSVLGAMPPNSQMQQPSNFGYSKHRHQTVFKHTTSPSMRKVASEDETDLQNLLQLLNGSDSKSKTKQTAKAKSDIDELQKELAGLMESSDTSTTPALPNPKVRADNDEFFESLQKLIENSDPNAELKENSLDFKANSNADLENRLKNLQKHMAITEKIGNLEKKIKNLQEAAENKAIDDDDESDIRNELKKMQRQLKKLNKSKAQGKGLNDEEDVLDELKSLQTAINSLKPKEDDLNIDTSQAKDGVSEFQIMLNKILNKQVGVVPVAPVIPTSAAHHLSPAQVQYLKRLMQMKRGNNNHHDGASSSYGQYDNHGGLYGQYGSGSLQYGGGNYGNINEQYSGGGEQYGYGSGQYSNAGGLYRPPPYGSGDSYSATGGSPQYGSSGGPYGYEGESYGYGDKSYGTGANQYGGSYSNGKYLPSGGYSGYGTSSGKYSFLDALYGGLYGSPSGYSSSSKSYAPSNGPYGYGQYGPIAGPYGKYSPLIGPYKPGSGPSSGNYGPSTGLYRPTGGKYGGGSAQYGSGSGLYGAGGGQYGSSGGQYGADGGQYGSSDGQYGAGGGQYGTGGEQYETGDGQYGSSGGQYGAGGGQYGAGGGQYGASRGQYGAGGGQYGSNGGQYGAGRGQYGAGGGQYGSNGGQYGAGGGQYGSNGGQYGAGGEQYGADGVQYTGAYGSGGLQSGQYGPGSKQYGPSGFRGGPYGSKAGQYALGGFLSGQYGSSNRQYSGFQGGSSYLGPYGPISIPYKPTNNLYRPASKYGPAGEQYGSGAEPYGFGNYGGEQGSESEQYANNKLYNSGGGAVSKYGLYPYSLPASPYNVPKRPYAAPKGSYGKPSSYSASKTINNRHLPQPQNHYSQPTNSYSNSQTHKPTSSNPYMNVHNVFEHLAHGYQKEPSSSFFPGYHGQGYQNADAGNYKPAANVNAPGTAQPYGNSQQNQVPSDSYSNQQVGELKTQIYTLQNVISNLNRPEYTQKPEDQETIYKLDQQISHLKSVVNHLSEDTPNSEGHDYGNGGPADYSAAANDNYLQHNSGYQMDQDNSYNPASDSSGSNTYDGEDSQKALPSNQGYTSRSRRIRRSSGDYYQQKPNSRRIVREILHGFMEKVKNLIGLPNDYRQNAIETSGKSENNKSNNLKDLLFKKGRHVRQVSSSNETDKSNSTDAMQNFFDEVNNIWTVITHYSQRLSSAGSQNNSTTKDMSSDDKKDVGKRLDSKEADIFNNQNADSTPREVRDTANFDETDSKPLKVNRSELLDQFGDFMTIVSYFSQDLAGGNNSSFEELVEFIRPNLEETNFNEVNGEPDTSKGDQRPVRQSSTNEALQDQTIGAVIIGLFKQLKNLVDIVDDLAWEVLQNNCTNVEAHEDCNNSDDAEASDNTSFQDETEESNGIPSIKRRKRQTDGSEEEGDMAGALTKMVSFLKDMADEESDRESENDEVEEEKLTDSQDFARSNHVVKEPQFENNRQKLQQKLQDLKNQLDSKLHPALNHLSPHLNQDSALSNQNFQQRSGNNEPYFRSSYYQQPSYYQQGYYQQPYYYPQVSYYQTPSYDYDKEKPTKFKIKKKKTKKDDVLDKIFQKILDKILDKVIKAIPIIIRRLLGLGLDNFLYKEDDYGYEQGGYGQASYDNKGYGVKKDYKQFGLFSFIPMLILQLVSHLTSFVNKLKKNKFIKTFLVPGFVTVSTAGLVVFLVWWLTGDDEYGYNSYNSNQIGYGYSQGGYGYRNNLDNYNDDGYSDNQVYNAAYEDDYYRNSNSRTAHHDSNRHHDVIKYADSNNNVNNVGFHSHNDNKALTKTDHYNNNFNYNHYNPFERRPINHNY